MYLYADINVCKSRINTFLPFMGLISMQLGSVYDKVALVGGSSAGCKLYMRCSLKPLLKDTSQMQPLL